MLTSVLNFLTWLEISPRKILGALTMYSIVRGSLSIYKASTSEAGKIIKQHHKHGHSSPTKACKQGDCYRLTSGRSDQQRLQVEVLLPEEYL